MLNRLKKIFAIFAVAILVTSCQSKKEVEDKSSDIKVSGTEYNKGIMTLSSDFPEDINPLSNMDESYSNIMKLVYDGLYSVDSNYNTVADIAQESSISEDGKRVHIKLNRAKYNDGEYVTSKDVADSVDYIKSAKNSLYKENVSLISKVIPVDEYSLDIEFTSPNPLYKYDLVFPIVKNPYTIDSEAYNSRTGKNISFDSNGKYMVKSFGSRKDMELVRNPEYYKDIIYSTDNIKVAMVPDDNARMEMIKSLDSQIDIVDVANLSKFQEKPFELKSFEGRNFDAIVFNRTNSIFQNAQIRNAVAKTLNMDEILKTAYLDSVTRVPFPLHSNSELLKVKQKDIYDSKAAMDIMEKFKNNLKAKKELTDTEKETLYALNNSTLKILVDKNSQERVRAAEILKENLKRIGISSVVDDIDFELYKGAIDRNDFDIAIIGYQIDNKPDIAGFMNMYSIKNAKLDGVLKEMENARSENELKNVYQKLEKLQAENHYFIPIGIKKYYIVVNDDIEGEIKPVIDNIFYNINELIKK